MKSVEDLDVFKLAHQLALKTYSTTKVFPREETFSLVDQMRRAATSVGMQKRGRRRDRHTLQFEGHISIA
jgi:four helix bundle protein